MYTVKEIHKYGTQSQGPFDVSLTDGYAVTDFDSQVVLHSGQYATIFKEHNKDSSQSNKRLSIAKITYYDEQEKRKFVIRREVNCIGISDLTKDDVGLTFRSLKELGITDKYKKQKCKVSIEKGCWFLFYWYHIDHAARISTRIGLISLIITIASFIVGIASLIVALC